MQIIIKGKQMEISPRLRQHIERKVQKLTRLVEGESRLEVTVAEEQTRSNHDRFSVQLAISGGGQPIRSEVSAVNANMALDLVLDKVVTQLGRQKDRHTTTIRHNTPAMKIVSLSRSGVLSPVEDPSTASKEETIFTELPGGSIPEKRNEEIWSKILEIRSMPTKPMNDQEAIAQMESSGLSFYPFINEETDRINVMYRLNKGGYGLLIPTQI